MSGKSAAIFGAMGCCAISGALGSPILCYLSPHPIPEGFRA